MRTQPCPLLWWQTCPGPWVKPDCSLMENRVMLYPTPETVTWQIHNVSKLLRLWEFVTQHTKLTFLSNFPFMNTLIDFSTDSQTPFISIYSIIIRYYHTYFDAQMVIDLASGIYYHFDISPSALDNFKTQHWYSRLILYYPVPRLGINHFSFPWALIHFYRDVFRRQSIF